MTTPTTRHFSMIRGFHLADLFTLANAACGVAAVFCAMLSSAAGGSPRLLRPPRCAGGVRLRRARRPHRPLAPQRSALGRELDSLADVISFGVAPAALAYAAGMRGAWDWIVLIYFVCCGVSRLARYNVTAEELSDGADKVAYFEGTPIPTSVLLVGVLAFAAWRAGSVKICTGGVWTIGPAELHPLALLFVSRHADDQQDAAHSEVVAVRREQRAAACWR